MKSSGNSNYNVWDYLWYALYAFAGLGLEILLLSFVEPMFLGKANDYDLMQNVIHWILTIICWAVIIVWLIKSSQKKLNYNIINNNKVSVKGLAISLILIIACILLNVYDWGTLKIFGEFSKKGIVEFVFQYLYYIFEVGLVYLIVVFGQKFIESLIKRKSCIPFGGIILCCTWGAIHILSQGSVVTGLGVMVFALMYGMMYLVLNRNTKLSFLAMLSAFII